MEQKYTISTGWKIFYGLLAIGMLVFAIFLTTIDNPGISQAILLFPLLITAGSILIIVNLVKRKVVINDHSILCVNVFLRRELEFAAIAGCRMGSKAILLQPINAGDRRIVIGNYTDLERSEELAGWIRDHFKDLDSIDLRKGQGELLQDSRLGSTEADRQKMLKKCKDVALAYNILGAGLGISLLFFNGKPSIIVLLAIPIAGVVIMLFSKGIIKFVSDSKRSPYPYIAPGAAISGFALLIKSLYDYTLFRFDHLWAPAFIISGSLFVLFYIPGINRSVKPVWGQAVFMAVLALLYGFGSVRQVNCAFDNSRQVIYDAIVLSHRVYRGKRTSHYLTLTPWGPRANEQEEEVNKRVYNHVAIGDTVEVNFRQGLLHIPWFIVEEGRPVNRPVLIRPVVELQVH
jgi:hypothetical protein